MGGWSYPARHGGALPTALALRLGPRAVVLNDAGGGRDAAGRACLDICNAHGVAACTADARSCRIGDAADMMARGRVSAANRAAQAVGVRAGLSVREAAARLARSPLAPLADVAVPGEARQTLHWGGRAIVLVDSASLVEPGDAGTIVVTGSHGGLIGGDSARALKADAFVALFNDAGLGPNGSGASRLPALNARGIAAATVSASSARIGEALSTLHDGVISKVNMQGMRLGIRVGDDAKAVVEHLASDQS